MSKRKREEKVIPPGIIRENSLLISLANDLWIHVAEYFNFRELATLSFLNKNFSLIAWQAMTNIYKERFIYFPFSYSTFPDNLPPSWNIELLKALNKIRTFYDSRYFTLFDPAYIELFRDIEEKDSKKAQAFVESQGLTHEHGIIVDSVSYQKNPDGETPLTLARHHGLQDFLDFFFRHLILNKPQSNQKQDNLVITGRYSDIISDLDAHTSMSEFDADAIDPVLFTYALADLCNQKDICNQIAATVAWRNAWKLDDKASLLRIAVLLSNLSLMRTTLVSMSSEENGSVAYAIGNPSVYYSKKSFYITRKGCEHSIIAIAIYGRHRGIISELKSFYQRLGRSWHPEDLLYSFIEQGDFNKFRAFHYESEDDELSILDTTIISNKYLNVHSTHLITLPGFSIIKNNLEFVKFFVESENFSLREANDDNEILPYPLSLAIEFGRVDIIKYLLSSPRINPNGYDNPISDALNPIFEAVKQNNLPIVKLLVENKASLEIENKRSKDGHRYPLIGAILEENAAIAHYLLRKLGLSKAQTQLQAALSYFNSNPGKQQFLKDQFRQYSNDVKSIGHRQQIPQKNPSKQKSLTNNPLNWLPLSEALWPSLPKASWLWIATYLGETDFLRFLQTNQTFAFTLLQRMKDFYYHVFSLDFSVSHMIDFTKSLYRLYASFHPRYYTLFDSDYIELFILVERQELEKIKDFILSKWHDPYLIDKVFYQKDGRGETAVTLAWKLKFQECLDYFFDSLIVNESKTIRQNLVNFGNYQTTLAQLNSGTMSSEVLWLFSLAFVCNQQAMLKKPGFQKEWTDVNSTPLLMIAAMLSSEPLYDFTLDQVAEYKISDQLWLMKEYKAFELHVNQFETDFCTIDMIGLGKNPDLIKKLEFGTQINSEVLLVLIQNKDLARIDHYWQQEKDEKYFLTGSDFPNTHFRIRSKAQLNAFILAIVYGWMEGIEYIFKNVFSAQRKKENLNNFLPNPLSMAVEFKHYHIAEYFLINGAHPDGFISPNPEVKDLAPIFYAIKNNHLELLKLLIQYRCNPSMQNRVDSLHLFPVVSAILYCRPEISSFLINKIIGVAAAVSQIARVLNSRLGTPRDHNVLKKNYEGLIHFASNRTNLFHAPGSQSCVSSTTNIHLNH